MKKIIERNITNEDGDAYGVVGDITRLGAYRAIRQDLREYGIADDDDVQFKQEDLAVTYFEQTTKCPHGGEHEDWIWWGESAKGDTTKELGRGWILLV